MHAPSAYTARERRFTVGSGREEPSPGAALYKREYAARPLWDLTYVQLGRSLWRSDAFSYETRPGDVILLRPGFPKYEYELPTDCGLHQTWCQFSPRPHWGRWLDWPEVGPGTMLLSLRGASREVRAGLDQALEAVIKANREPVRHPESLALCYLESALIWLDQVNPKSQEANVDPRLQRIVERMSGQLDQPHTLESLAEVGGVSVSLLGLLFRRTYHQSPMQFLTELRVDRAKQLLHGVELSIKQIAHLLGFRNAYYFSRRFRNATGQSPSEYRKNRQRKPGGSGDPPG